MKKKIMYVILVLVLCGVASGVTYYFTKKGNQEKVSTSSNIEEVKNNTSVVLLSNSEAMEVVTNVMDEYYQNIFHLNRGVYCGERDTQDFILLEDSSLPGEYYASVSYKNMNELKNYLSGFLSQNFINYLTSQELVSDIGFDGIEPYRFENGKLYCYAVSRGALSFVSGDYQVTKIEAEKISAEAEVLATGDGSKHAIHSKFTLIKENSHWFLDSYEEVSRAGLNTGESFVDQIMDEYYKNIFHLHNGVYCGKRDSSDVLEMNNPSLPGEYTASLEYRNLEELKNYLRTIASTSFVNYLTSQEVVSDIGFNGIEPYRFENGKLYCYAAPRGGLTFDSAAYILSRGDNKTITGHAYGSGKFATEQETFEASFTLIRENNKWVLDQYHED